MSKIIYYTIEGYLAKYGISRERLASDLGCERMTLYRREKKSPYFYIAECGGAIDDVSMKFKIKGAIDAK